MSVAAPAYSHLEMPGKKGRKKVSEAERLRRERQRTGSDQAAPGDAAREEERRAWDRVRGAEAKRRFGRGV